MSGFLNSVPYLTTMYQAARQQGLPGLTSDAVAATPDSSTIAQRIKEEAMNGKIPPPVEKGRIPAEFAKMQLAAKSGDDMNAFPSERNVPESAQRKVQQSYEQTVDKYMNQREKLIDNMQARAKIIRETESGMDLSPLLALVDSETGSNLQRGYQAPMTPQQREMLAQRLDIGASQALGGLANLRQQQNNQSLLEEKWKRDAAIREKVAGIRAGQKPMSGEQLKRLDYVIGAEDALGRLTSAVNDQTVTIRPDIPMVGDNVFTEALRDASENYGRMQSGGAINKDEEKRFLAKVYKMGDSREDILRKIKQFQKEMKGRRTRILSKGEAGIGEPNTQVSDDQFLKDLGL